MLYYLDVMKERRYTMTFGEKLKIARSNVGLKQAELAKQLGTTGNTISNWENNVSKPDLDTLSYICGVLKVKASYFLEAKVPEDEISLTEFNIIKKYRALDDHGKEMVDFTLQKEYDRSIALRKEEIEKYRKWEEQIHEEIMQLQTEINSPRKIQRLEDIIAPFPSEDDEILDAAHTRTDIQITDEDIKNDDDIMDGTYF